jgi:cell division protein FtsQ
VAQPRVAISPSAASGGRGRGRLRRLGRFAVRLAVMGTLAWGLLVGVREGYDYATTSPRFEVRALTYDPTPHVSDDELRRLMALEPGTNILSLDLEAIAQRIAAHPWVERASVVRVLPDALHVEVTEHEPIAVLLAGDFYLLDDGGTPFKPLEAGERGELPVVTGIDRTMLLTSSPEGEARIARALEAMALYDEKRRPRLSEIHVGDAGAVTLYTAELGTQLQLGRGDLARGLQRYDALRAALADEAEKLAIVHLDATPGESRSDRVVASFFPAKDAPSLVEDAAEKVEAQAEAFAAKEQAEAERAQGVGTAAPQASKQSKLPRYH